MKNTPFIISGIGLLGLIFFMTGVMTGAKWIQRFDHYWNSVIRVGITDAKTTGVSDLAVIDGVAAICILTAINIIVFVFMQLVGTAVWYRNIVLIGGGLIPS
ncbi:phosphatase PAP2 family protein, partial [Escherichia coli]|uniref:hypothetical protein n=1 Tax=Escherichia coli TaxID=562 RepID=UPI000D4DF84B